MFGLFRKKSPLAKMKQKVSQLQEEAFLLSHSDRKAAEAKLAEADALQKEIDLMENNDASTLK
jgi:hypothetical protein